MNNMNNDYPSWSTMDYESTDELAETKAKLAESQEKVKHFRQEIKSKDKEIEQLNKDLKRTLDVSQYSHFLTLITLKKE